MASEHLPGMPGMFEAKLMGGPQTGEFMTACMVNV